MRQTILNIKMREKFIKQGVKMIAPETVFFSKDTKIGKNVTIEPYVVFGKKVKINLYSLDGKLVSNVYTSDSYSGGTLNIALAMDKKTFAGSYVLLATIGNRTLSKRIVFLK